MEWRLLEGVPAEVADLAGTSRAPAPQRGTIELGRRKTIVTDPDALNRRAR